MPKISNVSMGGFQTQNTKSNLPLLNQVISEINSLADQSEIMNAKSQIYYTKNVLLPNQNLQQPKFVFQNYIFQEIPQII